MSDHGKKPSGHFEKAKATPIKQAAYAGSNFQQSPAASALPLPSFYSKSLPTVSSIPTPPPTSNVTIDQPASVTPADESPSKREATPCDFLFEAARQARGTPRAESPATRSGNLSIPAHSPASRSPGPREVEALFPFELEGGTAPGEDGFAFATPYKDRMEALRLTRSTSRGKSMDENERKAKSDALKKLLMKSSGHEAANTDASNDMNNPFNARAPYQPNQESQLQLRFITTLDHRRRYTYRTILAITRIRRPILRCYINFLLPLSTHQRSRHLRACEMSTAPKANPNMQNCPLTLQSPHRSPRSADTHHNRIRLIMQASINNQFQVIVQNPVHNSLKTSCDGC